MRYFNAAGSWLSASVVSSCCSAPGRGVRKVTTAERRWGYHEGPGGRGWRRCSSPFSSLIGVLSQERAEELAPVSLFSFLLADGGIFVLGFGIGCLGTLVDDLGGDGEGPLWVDDVCGA